MISEQELIANLQKLLQEKDTHIQSLQNKVQT